MSNTQNQFSSEQPGQKEYQQPSSVNQNDSRGKIVIEKVVQDNQRGAQNAPVESRSPDNTPKKYWYEKPWTIIGMLFVFNAVIIPLIFVITLFTLFLGIGFFWNNPIGLTTLFFIISSIFLVRVGWLYAVRHQHPMPRSLRLGVIIRFLIIHMILWLILLVGSIILAVEVGGEAGMLLILVLFVGVFWGLPFLFVFSLLFYFLPGIGGYIYQQKTKRVSEPQE